jgi:N-acetylglucosamine malate deacetylase 1
MLVADAITEADPQSTHRPVTAILARPGDRDGLRVARRHRTKMLELKGKRVMILAPHTDDGEFGCGGTIAKLLEQGAEVFYTAFSVCEQAVPYGFQQDELERELLQATAVMEIPRHNVLIHRYEVRRFPLNRQEILQDILDTKREVNPDLVFMPCLTDIHQDHQVVAMEGLRAYKRTTILSYEMPWNNISIQTSTFVTLEERHIERKVAAIACYQTQGFRHYANAEFIRALAVTRGAQIGVPLAEVFELVRLVL